MMLLFFSLKYKFFRAESTLSCQIQQYCSSLHSQKETFPQVLAPGFSNLYCNFNWSTRPKRSLRIMWEHCEFWWLNKSLLMRNSDVWQVLSADNFPFHQAFFKVKNTLSLTSSSASVSRLILPLVLQMFQGGSRGGRQQLEFRTESAWEGHCSNYWN